VTNFTVASPRSFLLLTNQDGQLAYGDRFGFDPPHYYGAWWNATINSEYDGSLGITQIIKANESAYFSLAWDDQLNSLDEPVADAKEFYNLPIGYTVTNIPSHTIHFQDFPEISPDLSWSWTSLEVNFADSQDYIRFKPNGDGIYVSLGIVDWKAHGLYSKIYGWQTNSTPAPSQPDGSDDFPVWKKIHPE
jgi:hypothetical protein